MERSEYLKGAVWVRKDPTPWSPTVKLILAFILGFLALSPAILGLYWEMLLGK